MGTVSAREGLLVWRAVGAGGGVPSSHRTSRSQADLRLGTGTAAVTTFVVFLSLLVNRHRALSSHFPSRLTVTCPPQLSLGQDSRRLPAV